MKRLILAGAIVVSADVFAAEPPVLRMPGSPDRSIAPQSLLGPKQSDVRLENMQGEVTIFHGLPLLDVLETNGLEAKSMPAERKTAPAVVVATARDGYAVVFSVGELQMHRSDPRIYLVAETAKGPLPPDQGPVRLVVLGQRARSAYALATIEVRYLAENPKERKP